mmetsp:Transcript_28583/g.47998  ORF Transcript_28583/g.47998 Transcript_28583/m.47998 type:complete len:432 (+) Transcript_28583:822-2117(+)
MRLYCLTVILVALVSRCEGRAKHECQSRPEGQRHNAPTVSNGASERIVRWDGANRTCLVKSASPGACGVSVVVTARLDSYAGGIERRTVRAVSTLMRQLATYYDSSEIIIVEWGVKIRSDNKSDLAEYIKQNIFMPSNVQQACHVRVVQVPETVAQEESRNPKQHPYLEYHAKNVGMRRAKYDWILVTNPDNLFPETTIEFMASGLTTPENFYRARLVQLNMTEAGLDEIPSDDLANVMKSWTLPAKQSHFYCFWNYDAFLPLCQVENMRNPEYRFDASKAPVRRPFGGASGDFILAHRHAWQATKGFIESGSNDHVDALQVCRMIHHGYTQVVLQGECHVLHQSHPHARHGRPNPGGADSTPLCRCLIPHYHDERKPTGSLSANNETACWDKFPRFVLENWGIPNEQLPTFDVIFSTDVEPQDHFLRASD